MKRRFLFPKTTTLLRGKLAILVLTMVLAFSSFASAQNPTVVVYDYDEAGNRTVRTSSEDVTAAPDDSVVAHINS